MLSRTPRAPIDFTGLENLEQRNLFTASYDIGINVNDSSPAMVAKSTPIMKSLGVKTVRLWSTVSDFNGRTLPAPFQRAMDYSRAGFDVMMEVHTKDGRVTDAAAVKGWFAWAAAQPGIADAIDHWEIGNEVDSYQYWKGSLSQYVNQYLKPAYEALNPAGEEVVSAGPSYDPADIQEMIDHGMLNYTDYVGAHPYANGVTQVKNRIAQINAVVAGRKPIAATEWNVRGYEGDKTKWANAITEAYPYIKAGFDLNYYFCLEVQNTPAGPGGILTTAGALNQPFYNAFATFNGSGEVENPLPGDTGSTPSGSAASITGTLFNDADEDGVFDTNESATGSRTVYLDSNANGAFDSGERTTTSNASGVYTFSGLTAGTYNVSRVFPGGYKLSNNDKGYVTTTVATAQKRTGVNIGTTEDDVAGSPSTPPTPTVPSTPTVPTVPTTPSATVSEFVLINAATNQVIGSMPVIKGNVTVNLALLPKGGINIKVVTGGAVESVKMTALGRTFVESNTPYAFFGDLNGDYYAWVPKAGSFTVSATAYTGDNATGTQGGTLTATVTIV